MVNKRLTFEEFEKLGKLKFGSKFCYNKNTFVNGCTKTKIVCPEHGEFWQTPKQHLRSKFGCEICGRRNQVRRGKLDLEEFLDRAKEKHGEKYSYGKVTYHKNDEKVCIICPEHGEFWQTPKAHLNGQGCPKCGNKYNGENGKLMLSDFIKMSNEKHNGKYNYDKVEYAGSHTKICITCPIHGEFWQLPYAHLIGNGCPKCKNEIISKLCRSTTEKFIELSKNVHGNRYAYSNVDYKDSKTKVCIICPEHGEFWQTPNNHLMGQGCPKCKQSKLEVRTSSLLDDEKIPYVPQKTFDWLKNKGNLYLDFFLPNYNLAIECQGRQHFEPSPWGEKDKGKILEAFEDVKKRDAVKKRLCEEHGIKVEYINYNDDIEKRFKEIIGALSNKALEVPS